MKLNMLSENVSFARVTIAGLLTPHDYRWTGTLQILLRNVLSLLSQLLLGFETLASHTLMLLA